MTSIISIRRLALGTLAATTMLLAASSANALTLTQSATPTVKPAGSSTLFSAIGTFNFGNQKARLEYKDPITLATVAIQGGNPANGWFAGGVVRSWEVTWDNTTKTVSYKMYSSSDWSGPEATNGLMNVAPTFLAGNQLIGLSIAWRLTATTQSLVLDNIQFNDGSGWVDVDTAEGTFTGNFFFDNYHYFSGTMTNWTLRGTAAFPTGSVTSDNMRFIIYGVQGTPPNTAPVAVNDSYTVSEDNVLNVDASLGVLDNDTDAENDPLTAVLVTDVSNGTLDLNTDGSFTYTPNPNFNGTDSFTYKADDGAGQSNEATVTITVNAVMDYTVTGFFAPVDMGGVTNIAKAGRTIPLKFRVVDENGPYGGLTLADVAVTTNLDLGGTPSGPDEIETYSGSSGLQYLGDGYYQYNWKTPTDYAGQTRWVSLTITKEGQFNPNPISALFFFRR